MDWWASDSRQTVDGTYCDGAEKFFEPKNSDRLTLAVTGRRGFYPVTIAVAPDPCDYVRQTRREFDLGEVANAFIEKHGNVDLNDFDLGELANHCVQALTSYLSANPHRLPTFSGDHFASAVLLASYDPKTRVAIVRSFEIGFSPSGTQLIARLGLDERFGPDDLAEPMSVGEGDYLREQVLPIIKDLPISETTRNQLGDFPNVRFEKVGAMSLQQAVEIATDLIESAARMTAKVPAKSGIGGPLDIRLLGESVRPVRLK
jgi:hypothetical protein